MDHLKNKELLSAINEIFNEKVPFHKVLGLQVKSINHDSVQIHLEMKDELMGNYIRKTLHGGVISTVIDVTAALAAFMGIQGKMDDETLEKRLARIGNLGTISLHVDYLRPGKGGFFIATGYCLKAGNKVAVTRVEMHDELNDLIAVGAGSYTVA
jgi:uncharacterized protein (TIGR00369 family)